MLNINISNKYQKPYLPYDRLLYLCQQLIKLPVSKHVSVKYELSNSKMERNFRFSSSLRKRI